MKPLIKKLSLTALILFGSLYIVLKVLSIFFKFVNEFVILDVFLLAYLFFIPYAVYKASLFLELGSIKSRVTTALIVSALYMLFYLLRFMPIIRQSVEDKEPVPVFIHSFIFVLIPAMIVSFFFSYVIGTMMSRRKD